jgi:hypothetical protein
MPFEKVKSGGRVGGTQPLISLRKSGSIGINRSAYEEFFDGEEQAELYYDKENNELGIKALEEETEDSYTISVTESSASITAMSVMNQYKLTPEITTRFIPSTQKINGDTELVVVDMDNPHSTYGKPKSEEENK